MDYKIVGSSIIHAVGGKENVASVTHCVTRLRLVLKRESEADDDMVKAIPGVKGLMKANGQYQVIIGQEVSDLAAEVASQLGMQLGEVVAADTDDDEGPLKVPKAKEDDNLFNKFIRLISACIFPLCGLLIASGMLKGILTILTQVGWLDPTSGTYLVLNATSQATIYYLPVLAGFIAGKTFGCSPYLTAVLGGIMVYPDIVAAYSDGNSYAVFGVPLVLTKYASQLFPILIASWVAAKVEGFWKRVVPKVIALMCVPLLTLVVVAPLALLVIGPVMMGVSSVLANITMFLIDLSPTVAGAILGAFWQLLIMLGVARAFSPIMLNNFTTLGYDPIMALTGAGCFALAGAGLGYALRQRGGQARADSLTNALTAFFGVTEPIIYTLALPKKTPFVASWIGGAVGGAIMGFFEVVNYVYGGGGIFQALLVVSTDRPMNVVYFLVGAAVAFVVSLVVALAICKDEGAVAKAQ